MLAAQVQLMPDETLFIQLAIFLIVLVALNHFVFKPVLRIIALRREKTSGDLAKIEELTVKAGALVEEYDVRMREARREALSVKEAIRREGETQGQKIIQEARQASLAQRDQMRVEIKKETDRASHLLKSEAERIGRQLAEKLLDRPL